MSKTQREYYLRQQLKASRRSWASWARRKREASTSSASGLKKIGLPPEVEKVAKQGAEPAEEASRRPPPSTRSRAPIWSGSPNLPWSKKTEDNLDVENARGVLHKDTTAWIR